MMEEIRRIKKALRILEGAMDFLGQNIGAIPVEAENKNLMGYFNKIREEKTEFAMALDKLEQKFKPSVMERTEEEKLADQVKAGTLNIFIAADMSYHKQKFWKAIRKLSGEI